MFSPTIFLRYLQSIPPDWSARLGKSREAYGNHSGVLHEEDLSGCGGILVVLVVTGGCNLSAMR